MSDIAEATPDSAWMGTAHFPQVSDKKILMLFRLSIRIGFK